VRKRTVIALIVSHALAGAVGFAIGIYALPILIAPPAPSATEVEALSDLARYSAEFSRDRQDSDAFHWGEGRVSIGDQHVTLVGELAPGPDYRLYLSPEFVETESDFERLKPSMVEVGNVRTFDNFVVAIPTGIDPSQFDTVIVWCESFGEFITSAKYR
jgi:hypothetical protein